MGVPRAGEVVSFPFPFSDLSGRKLRPALVIASVGRGDYVLCQITSNPQAGGSILNESDFSIGGLRHVSYAMPAKLFTASESLMVRTHGELTDARFEAIVHEIVGLIRSGLRST